jgi:hypothetical protein
VRISDLLTGGHQPDDVLDFGMGRQEQNSDFGDFLAEHPRQHVLTGPDRPDGRPS